MHSLIESPASNHTRQLILEDSGCWLGVGQWVLQKQIRNEPKSVVPCGSQVLSKWGSPSLRPEVYSVATGNHVLLCRWKILPIRPGSHGHDTTWIWVKSHWAITKVTHKNCQSWNSMVLINHQYFGEQSFRRCFDIYPHDQVTNTRGNSAGSQCHSYCSDSCDTDETHARTGRAKSLARLMGLRLVKPRRLSIDCSAITGLTARIRPSCGGCTPKKVKLMSLHQVTLREKLRSRAAKKAFAKRTRAPKFGSLKLKASRSCQHLGFVECGIGTHLFPSVANTIATSKKDIL